MTDAEKIIPVAEEKEVIVEATVNESDSKNVHAMSKEELLAELKNIVEEENVNAHKEVMALKQALFAVRQREINDELNAFVEAGNAPETFSATPDPSEYESKELLAKFKEMRARFLEAEEKRLEANLAAKRELIKEMQAIVEDADNVNVNFSKFQELQQAFKNGEDVTPSSEAEIWKAYQTTVEQFYDTLKINKELRDLDFKKNLEQKRQLIEQAVALQGEEDIIDASARLRQLHNEWRAIGPVVKELRDTIWEEFKEASAIINRKHQEFFEARKNREKENEDAKIALCLEVENIDLTSLTTFAQWEEMTEKVKTLQAQWKTIGFASRKVNNELFARFRKANDIFFETKAAYMQGVKDNLQANLEKKIALCEKAEALGDVDDLKKNLDEVIRLQAEWKKIGTVPKKHSDSVWQRFTAACNKFFDRKKEQDAARHNEENANLEAKRSIIVKLKAIPLDGERREILKMVRDLQNEWAEIGHVPYKQKDKVYAQYREICDAIYESINAKREDERRQNFEGQLNKLKGDDRKIKSERDRLQRVIEQKQNDLKTYQNNLGFFNVKSSAGNSMVKDMERKMARLEEEIKDLKAKIRMLAEAEK